jgi:DNA-binding MarR family transcriptional regulator
VSGTSRQLNDFLISRTFFFNFYFNSGWVPQVSQTDGPIYEVEMNSPLDFRELRALLVTVRSGSITNAAKELNLGQPDLTRSLRRLEEKLGVALFERHARGVRLTEAGSIMAERAQKALTLLHNTAVEINVSGETLRTLVLPPVYQSYTHRHGQRTSQGVAA